MVLAITTWAVAGKGSARSGRQHHRPAVAPAFVRLERPSGKLPYVAMVKTCLLPDLAIDERAGVLLHVRDPEKTGLNHLTALIQAFDLTDAEARVGVLLMQGQTPKDIA